MAGFTLYLDPTSDDATNSQLNIADGTNYFIKDDGLDFPPPPLNPQYATSADTEGSIPVDLQYQNRKVTIKLRVTGSSAASLETKLAAIYQKVGKFNREGGVLGVTTPSTAVYYFDILPEAVGGNTFDKSYAANFRAEATLELTCKPFWREAEVMLADNTETTSPVV